MATPSQTYGIVLPIAHGPQGFFNSSYTLLDQVKSNINVLLKTKKGERRMNPEFGSSLWDILFENYNTDISPLIKTAIQRDISQWLGYVKIQDVQVYNDTEENQNQHKVGIKITFIVPSIGITRSQSVQVAISSGNI